MCCLSTSCRPPRLVGNGTCATLACLGFKEIEEQAKPATCTDRATRRHWELVSFPKTFRKTFRTGWPRRRLPISVLYDWGIASDLVDRLIGDRFAMWFFLGLSFSNHDAKNEFRAPEEGAIVCATGRGEQNSARPAAAVVANVRKKALKKKKKKLRRLTRGECAPQAAQVVGRGGVHSLCAARRVIRAAGAAVRRDCGVRGRRIRCVPLRLCVQSINQSI